MANAALTLRLKAEDEASSTLKKVASEMGGVEKAGGSLESKLGGLAKAGIGVFGLGELGEAAHGVLEGLMGDALEAQNTQAQLAAVLKSTGGAAGVSANEVNELAEQLKKITPYDDDAVVSGENLLLTFTNIGEDVFPEATKTMLDMSTALGQDLKGSAIQLGKALNDPITGMTALRRVGVSFTQAQIDQITAMEKSGDLMGAQKMVLAELSKEFGGSAEAAGTTFAGKLKILNNEFNDVKKSIVLAVLPALTEMLQAVMPIVQAMGERLPGAIKAVSGFFAEMPGPVKAVLAVLGGLAVAAIPVGMALGMIGTIVGPLFGLFGALAGAVPLVGVALAALTGPIGLVVLGIAGIIAIGKLLIDHWGQVQQVAGVIWQAVTGAFQAAATVIVGVVQGIIDWVRGNWPLLVAIMGGPVGIAAALIATHLDEIKGFFTTAWSAITSFLSDTFSNIGSMLSGFASSFQSAWTGLWEGVQSFATGAWDALRTGMGNLFAGLSEAFAGFGDAFSAGWSGLWTGIGAEAANIWSGIQSAISGGLDAISATLATFTSGFQSAWDGFWAGVGDTFSGVWQGMHDAVAGAISGIKSVINSLISGWNKLHFSVPSVNVDAGPIQVHFGGANFGVPSIPLMDSGGIFEGPGLVAVGPIRERFTPLSGSGARAGDMAPIVINVNAPVYGVDHLEDVVVTAVTRAQRRGRL